MDESGFIPCPECRERTYVGREDYASVLVVNRTMLALVDLVPDTEEAEASTVAGPSAGPSAGAGSNGPSGPESNIHQQNISSHMVQPTGGPQEVSLFTSRYSGGEIVVHGPRDGDTNDGPGPSYPAAPHYQLGNWMPERGRHYWREYRPRNGE